MGRGGRCRGRSRDPGPEGEAGGGGRGEGGGGGARHPAPPTPALPQGRLRGGDAASEGEAGATVPPTVSLLIIGSTSKWKCRLRVIQEKSQII